MCYRDLMLYCDVRVKQQRWHNCPQRQDQAALNEKHICHLEFKEFEPNPFQLTFWKWNMKKEFGHPEFQNFYIIRIVLYSSCSPAYFGEAKESPFLTRTNCSRKVRNIEYGSWQRWLYDDEGDGWSFARGRSLHMITCKRPAPLDDYWQDAGLSG